ncbi:MAG TPA: alkaline phosphatase family protein [Stellaceae bacterium]|jgi:phospholipase C
MPLADIQTIVVVMLENRSFDHAVGYLSLADTPLPVEGLRTDKAWLDPLANEWNGTVYGIYRLDPATQQIDDPAHDHNAIQVQISAPPAAGAPSRMGGFVQSYVRFSDKPPADPKLVMGYYDEVAVPVFDLFARQFAVCDHWFAALPTGTQANRLMAMSGESALVDDARVLLPDQTLVYDWLAQRQIAWCVYAKLFPFFSMMPRWSGEIATALALSAAGGRGRFRLYDKFRAEWQGAYPVPQVIFIEPEYTNGPHLDAADDHPPTGIAKGQAFLAEIYGVLTSNPARWANTMLIVTYDEHGGFFDHVPPLEIPTTAGGFPFATTGVRVPAFVVSPHVAPGTVFSQPLDHTSILQLLADRFAGGQDYSPAVAARQAHLRPLSGILADAPVPREPAPDLAEVAKVAGNLSPPPPPKGADLGDPPSAQAFRNAVIKIAGEHPDLAKSPGWQRLAAAIARVS